MAGGPVELGHGQGAVFLAGEGEGEVGRCGAVRFDKRDQVAALHQLYEPFFVVVGPFSDGQLGHFHLNPSCVAFFRLLEHLCPSLHEEPIRFQVVVASLLKSAHLAGEAAEPRLQTHLPRSSGALFLTLFPAFMVDTAGASLASLALLKDRLKARFHRVDERKGVMRRNGARPAGADPEDAVDEDERHDGREVERLHRLPVVLQVAQERGVRLGEEEPGLGPQRREDVTRARGVLPTGQASAEHAGRLEEGQVICPHEVLSHVHNRLLHRSLSVVVRRLLRTVSRQLSHLDFLGRV
mmetsp:Transcript_70186/g.158732  ORF Transcript_70186/g.158732 Transcript_70186/m.158732 type:complete len:296 (-) Transcript_70186:1702-2589(-)